MNPSMSEAFARYENMDACTREQMTFGHCSDDAAKICGTIKSRADKGQLYKAAEAGIQLIKTLKNGDLIIAGVASWDIADGDTRSGCTKGDRMTIPGQVDFLQKYLALPEQYRLMSIDHTSIIMGVGIHKFQDPDTGVETFSHVHEKGTFLVGKIRADEKLSFVRKYREDITKGVYKMFSIRASIPNEPGAYKIVQEGNDTVREIYKMDPIEVAIVQQGQNPMAHMGVLSKIKPRTVAKKSAEDLAKLSCEDLKTHLLELYGQRREIDAQLYPTTGNLATAPGLDAAPAESQLSEDESAALRDARSLLQTEIWACEGAYQDKLREDLAKGKITLAYCMDEMGKIGAHKIEEKQLFKAPPQAVTRLSAQEIFQKHFPGTA